MLCNAVLFPMRKSSGHKNFVEVPNFDKAGSARKITPLPNTSPYIFCTALSAGY